MALQKLSSKHLKSVFLTELIFKVTQLPAKFCQNNFLFKFVKILKCLNEN